MSQKATNLLRVLDHMHSYERYGHEIPDDPRIVQRLNQLHHDLAYGDIPEVECPTVIEFVKEDEDFPSWEKPKHTFFFYDDNGVLRKIVSGMSFFSKIPSNEALADVWVFGKNGNFRHCPAFNIVFACSDWDSPFLHIYSGAVRNGKFNYDRYELTEDNLFCDTFEPKPIPNNVRRWICGPDIPTPIHSLDDWHLKNDFYKVLIDTKASFRILKCSPKFEALLTERVPENAMTWKQVGDILYITGRGKLSNSAFYRNSSIRKVVIAPGCTIIGKSAFEGCEQLQEVELPEGLLCIGKSAFDGCEQLREVKMPESLRYIGNSAFEGCEQLREVKMPEGLLHIGRDAFQYCCHNDLKLHIPDSVIEIGENAFYDVPCIMYNGSGWYDRGETMKQIKNESGIFTLDYNDVLTGFQSAESNQIKENVWRCLDIPEGVRVIPEEAFCGCHVQQRLTFPKSLRMIGAGHGCAFANSILPHVELPATLEKLGDFVFGASTMDSLRIPRGLKSKYARQFKESRIGTLYLPEEFRADGTPYGFCEKYQGGQEQYGYIRSILVNNVRIGEVIFE